MIVGYIVVVSRSFAVRRLAVHGTTPQPEFAEQALNRSVDPLLLLIALSLKVSSSSPLCAHVALNS